ncbi:RNA polymerase subunit sigma-28 [Clostridium sp. 19966]|uniref:sigma factor n=1 Tax=Clostridium sp. 19966 TaxID=2768166 RepID=UPI0028DF3603|nr:sigma factor [Clostridium sp. 19966]MDT8718403.1 RNA polymerase subunit sigma-28 [Clostridium sp. 19966]
MKLTDDKNRNEFIEENKNFIYKATQDVCKRKLSSDDDELSIAMIAFNNACDNFHEDRGNFYGYAAVIIRNALIDHFRKAKNIPLLTFENYEDSKEYIEWKTSMNEYEKYIERDNRLEEIKLLSAELLEYKISFDKLVDSSPSHIDTRSSLLNLACLCLRYEEIVQYMKEKKQLPVKQIVMLTGTNRKFVEKWRRYIVVLIIVLSNKNYNYIRSYLNIKAGDKND